MGYKKNFCFLFFSSFTFFVSFDIIVVELSDFLTLIGGGDYKGFIISLPSLSAILFRILAVRLMDIMGKKKVMLIGVLVSVLFSLAYPFSASVFMFLTIRFFHGISSAFKPLAEVIYLSDVVPANKRYQHIALLGIAPNLSLMLAPYVGSYIAYNYGHNYMFFAAILFASASVVFTSFLNKDVREYKEVSKVNLFNFRDGKILIPTILIMMWSSVLGTILTIIPDYSKFIGLENKGVFLFFYVLGVILSRVFIIKFLINIKKSDIMLIFISLIILAIAMIMNCYTSMIFNLSAFILGISMGILTPVLLTWVMEISSKENKNRYFTILFIGIEIGIIMGAYISAYVYDDNIDLIRYSFVLSMILCIVSFFVVLFMKLYRKL